MYKLFITDVNGNKIAYVRNLVPLDGTEVLRFDDYISSYGSLRFRVQTKDPILTSNILEPHRYCVQLYRNNSLVFAGPIVNNPKRNHQFIEVEAKTWAWYLTKVQVAHSVSTDTENWREFKTGTMAAAITALFNEGKGRSNSPISDWTLQVTNPDYPWQTGTGWTFSDVYKIQFEYADMMRVLSSFADITNADFTVTKEKVLTFAPHIGTTRNDITLRYGRGGNIENYDSPLDGENMNNDFVMESFDSAGAKIIKSSAEDLSNQASYKRLWAGAILNEKLDQKQLDEKRKRIMNLNNALDTELNLTLGETALPFGTYNLGDTVTVQIHDGIINVNTLRRIIGWKVSVMSNGVERVTLSTNNNF